MGNPKFSEDVRPLSELKTKTSKIIEHVQRSKRPVLLTKRGRGVAVMIELKEYEKLVDRAGFIEAINIGTNALKDGDLHEHSKAEGILDSFGESHD